MAAIAREPMFATPARSLAGRALRYVIELVRDLFDLFRGSRDMRMLAIAAVVVVVAVVAARLIIARRLDQQRQESAGHRGARIRRADPWSAANSYAAEGDYTAACHALYAAVIESLARDGRIKLHASKTSGDYARELRRRGASIARDFVAFGRRYDRVIYGTGQATADDFAALSALADHTVQFGAAA